MLIKTGVRGVLRNKRRTLLTMLAISLALATLVLMNAFMDGTNQSMFEKIVESSGHIQLYAPGYYDESRTLPTDIAIGDLEATMETVRGVEGVVDSTAQIRFGGMVIHGGDDMAGFFIGVEPEGAARVNNLDEKVIEGEYFASGDEDVCLVGKRMAELMKLEVGDPLTVVTQTAYGALTAMDFTVKGIVYTLNPMIDEAGVVLDLHDAQRHLELTDAATAILVVGESMDNTIELRDSLLAVLNPDGPPIIPEEGEIVLTGVEDDDLPLFAETPVGGFEIPDEVDASPTRSGFEGYTWQELSATIIELTDFKNQAMDIIRGIMIILAAAMIANTMLTNVFERTREIGVLMAMGARGRQIISLFLTEAVMLGVLGSLVGVALGAGVSLILAETGIDMGSDVTAMVTIPMDSVLYPLVDFTGIVKTFMLGVVMSLIAGLYPAVKAARLQPTKALRYL
jgi:putative ABC transport system permease protein